MLYLLLHEDIQLAKETIETDDCVDELHHFIGQHLPTQCFDKILSQQVSNGCLNMHQQYGL